MLETVACYRDYMVNFGKKNQKGKLNEKASKKTQHKKAAAESDKVAERPRRYKVSQESLSGRGSKLGSRVHGVREGAGGYKSSEGTLGEGKYSTRPLDSTHYFETALGIKPYSEVSEIIAVSVTNIKDYHEGDFEALLAVLKKNKQKLSIDPSSRKFQEKLEKHFKESKSVLAPLKNKIKATDNLIDQIVYKLYNLTSEEIEVVKGK